MRDKANKSLEPIARAHGFQVIVKKETENYWESTYKTVKGVNPGVISKLG